MKIFLESSDHYLLYICSSFNHFSTYESKSLLHPFLSPSNFSLFDRCFVIIRQNKKRKLSLNIIEMYMKFIKRTNRVIFEKTSSIHDQMRRKIDEEKVKKKEKVFSRRRKWMDGGRTRRTAANFHRVFDRACRSTGRDIYRSIDRDNLLSTNGDFVLLRARIEGGKRESESTWTLTLFAYDVA